MSMITEQIKRLRSEAAGMILQNGTTARLLREAADTIEALSAKVRKENGFIFPENATNGDMIKALFNTKEVEMSNTYCVHFPEDLDFGHYFFKDWWNSSYKRGDTE